MRAGKRSRALHMVSAWGRMEASLTAACVLDRSMYPSAIQPACRGCRWLEHNLSYLRVEGLHDGGCGLRPARNRCRVSRIRCARNSRAGSLRTCCGCMHTHRPQRGQHSRRLLGPLLGYTMQDVMVYLHTASFLQEAV